MSKDTGGPAFPVQSYVNSDGETFESEPQGMSLRDYFAAKAMQSMLAHPDSRINAPANIFAMAAYLMADAMLEERKNNG